MDMIYFVTFVYSETLPHLCSLNLFAEFGVDSGDECNYVLSFSCRSLFKQLIELLTQTA
jgi:hypothetical protein